MLAGKIGIKQADGKIIPVLDCAHEGDVTLRLEAANANQRKAKLEFYFMPSRDRKKPRRIQTLAVKNLASLGGPLCIVIGKIRRNRLQVRLSGRREGVEESFKFRIRRSGFLSLAAVILYAIVVLGLLAFLATQTIPELSLERLFGIKL